MANILVVEDDASIGSMIVDILAAKGYTAALLADPRGAVDAVRRERHDLVLLDVMMPHLNGFEVCRLLRADPATRAARIIIITALNRVADVEQGYSAGADDYIAKPVDIAQLISKVEKALARRR